MGQSDANPVDDVAHGTGWRHASADLQGDAWLHRTPCRAGTPAAVPQLALEKCPIPGY